MADLHICQEINQRHWNPKEVRHKTFEEHRAASLILHAAKILLTVLNQKIVGKNTGRKRKWEVVPLYERKNEERSHWTDKNDW